MNKPKFKAGDLLLEIKGIFRGELSKVREVGQYNYHLESKKTKLKYQWRKDIVEKYCIKINKKQMKLVRLFYAN